MTTYKIAFTLELDTETFGGTDDLTVDSLETGILWAMVTAETEAEAWAKVRLYVNSHIQVKEIKIQPTD